MKQLQNNFTTPDQSRRLLELGVPADSADMYYCRMHTKEFMLPTLIGDKATYTSISTPPYNLIFLPCWSAGRLIEIFIICTPYVEIGLRTRLVEQLIASYEDVLKQGLIDFSKLED